MQTLEAVSTRLHTTAEIHSIVRTMKSLSAVSIHQYDRAVAAIAEYERTVSLGLQIVLRDGGIAPPPGLADGTPRGAALIVIGSDRGLCGRFNDRICAAALDRLRTWTGGEVRPLCVIGQRAATQLAAAGHRPDVLFSLPGSVDGLATTVHAVAVEIERWTSGGTGAVSLLFNRRAGAALTAPTARVLLPVPHEDLDRLARAPWPWRRLPIYRMDRATLFSWLIGQRIFVELYRALAESLASEHASRLAAMQRAERNIGDLRDDLMGAFRQMRQQAITRELLDILAGFESVYQGDGT